jgi:hypothetical protein
VEERPGKEDDTGPSNRCQRELKRVHGYCCILCLIEVLTSCWPAIGIELARQQQRQIELQDPADPQRDCVWVLQGPLSPPASPSSSAVVVPDLLDVRLHFSLPLSAPLLRGGEVLLVHRGHVAVASAALLLSEVPSTTLEDEDVADYFVDTSHPGVASRKPESTQTPMKESQMDPAARLRFRVARYVAARWRIDVPAVNSMADQVPAVQSVSFLGSQHAQRALAQAALSAPLSSAPSPAGSSVPFISVRLHLQRTVLPLPLSEPDLLITVSEAHQSGERSLLAFPSWLLRVAELAFVSTLPELVHGDELRTQLHLFARTVQRGGT